VVSGCSERCNAILPNLRGSVPRPKVGGVLLLYDLAEDNPAKDAGEVTVGDEAQRVHAPLRDRVQPVIHPPAGQERGLLRRTTGRPHQRD
jgi:hypothetical protein